MSIKLKYEKIHRWILIDSIDKLKLTTQTAVLLT